MNKTFLGTMVASVFVIGLAVSGPANATGSCNGGNCNNTTTDNSVTNTATGGAGGLGGAGGAGGAGGDAKAYGGSVGNVTGGSVNHSGNSTNLIGVDVDNRNSNTLNNTNDLSNRNSNTNTNLNSNKQGQDQDQGQIQGQLQGQGQKQSTDNANNADQNVTVEGDTYKAPVSTAYSAPLTAADDTCMGSTSAGVQGMSFGVSLGSTWRDEDCVRRKDSRELFNMGERSAALARMCQNDDNRKALNDAGVQCPGQSEQAAAAIRQGTTVVSETTSGNTIGEQASANTTQFGKRNDR